jgi:hypothetical protein
MNWSALALTLRLSLVTAAALLPIGSPIRRAGGNFSRRRRLRFRS